MDILALRQKSGLSQRAFADLFEIPVRTLQQWEQNRSKPPTYVTRMIERLLPILLPTEASRARFAAPSRSKWKVCIDQPFLNCSRVYPIQQRKVAWLLEQLRAVPAVRRVIVFGSSVTPACHIGSDVDLYVELDKTGPQQLSPQINAPADFEFDLWTNFTADSRLQAEIEAKGVCVYERPKN